MDLPNLGYLDDPLHIGIEVDRLKLMLPGCCTRNVNRNIAIDQDSDQLLLSLCRCLASVLSVLWTPQDRSWVLAIIELYHAMQENQPLSNPQLTMVSPQKQGHNLLQ